MAGIAQWIRWLPEKSLLLDSKGTDKKDSKKRWGYEKLKQML